MKNADKTLEETRTKAEAYIHLGTTVGGLLGLVVGSGLVYSILAPRIPEANDIVLSNALSHEPAQTLLKKGYATSDQIRSAAEKGIQDLANAANTAFSPAESAQESARKAVAAYLADKSKPPVIAVPAPAAPAPTP